MAPSPITQITFCVSPLIAGDRHAEPGRYRSRGVGGAERVVFAFRALGEAGQAAAGTQSADAITASRENLVGIGLMPDVPDQPVAGRVENIMQCDRQLDHAEAGAEMAAGYRDGADRLFPQFIRNLLKVRWIAPTQITRFSDGIKHFTSSLLG